MRNRPSTPEHAANEPESAIEESPVRELAPAFSEKELPSLKKELGIEESHDGSPHRFFDWDKDRKGDGAADISSFTGIQDQIRQRNDRLRQIEIQKKEDEAASKKRRRERRERRRAERE